MDDNKFWLVMFRNVLIAVTICILSICGCNIHANKKIAEAIKNGARPDQARLAFSTQASDVERAMVILTTEGETKCQKR